MDSNSHALIDAKVSDKRPSMKTKAATDTLSFRTAHALECQCATIAFAHLQHSGTHTSNTRVFEPIPPEY